MKTNIDKKILIKIKTSIFTHIKNNDFKFFLFGSRVEGTASEKSDYDIWFLGEKKLDPLVKENIKSDFDSIPAIIDLVDFSEVSEVFKKEALKNILPLNY